MADTDAGAKVRPDWPTAMVMTLGADTSPAETVEGGEAVEAAAVEKAMPKRAANLANLANRNDMVTRRLDPGVLGQREAYGRGDRSIYTNYFTKHTCRVSVCLPAKNCRRCKTQTGIVTTPARFMRPWSLEPVRATYRRKHNRTGFPFFIGFLLLFSLFVSLIPILSSCLGCSLGNVCWNAQPSCLHSSRQM